MTQSKKKYKLYLTYFFTIAGFFFWLGMICGAERAYRTAEKQSEKYRVEMVKDSLYYEFIKRYD